MGRPRKEETPKKLTEQEFLLQNPNATPYNMVTAGVITAKRFEELSKAPEPVRQKIHEEEEGEEIQKIKPEIVKPTQVFIQPQLTSFTPTPNGTRVYLKDKKTAKTTLMSRGSAEREKKKYPNRYEII